MNSRDWDQSSLINELNQGKELVNQLRFHLSPGSPNGEGLIEKILTSIDNTLSQLNSNGAGAGAGADAEAEPQQMVSSGVVTTESPRSVSGSPRSDDSEIRDAYRKRKMLPRWSEQVRVNSEIEGPVEDGYSWRKYGQKDILGAKHPRGYYRCTHRTAHGCLATKQVQRSDENPSMFDVTYRGKHTCIQASHIMRQLQSPAKKEPKQEQQEMKRQKQSQEMILMNFKTGLKVKTENLDNRQFASSSSFSFPSSSSMDCTQSENNIFPSFGLENNYVDTFSPSFISPTTSESNYFSPCAMSSFGSGPCFQNPESAATSSSNSPIVDLDFALEPIEFDSNFFFNNPGFFT